MNPANAPHGLGRTLMFLASVGAVCALASWSGWSLRVGNTTLLSFPEWSAEDDSAMVIVQPSDVEELLATYPDESALADSMELAPIETDAPLPALADWLTATQAAAEHLGDSVVTMRTLSGAWAERRAAGTWKPEGLHPNLQFIGDSSAFQALWRFFETAARGGQATHVVHFGDSQIEGDRITSELRHAFQRRWGGTGPGLVSAVPQAQVPGFVHEAEGWTRHTLFGKRDTTLGHNRYGILATVGRWDATDTAAEWTDPISMRARNMGHARNRVWAALHVLAGPLDRDSLAVQIRCDSTNYAAWLTGDTTASALHVALPPSCREVEVRFEAPGPDVNALGFYADTGVVVHNVPMRGSSGTLFRKADRAHWTAQVKQLNPGLVLLQYGGNAVPYVEDEAEARQYARWLASQIRLFKTTLPGAPIVLIGPSDMSTKEGLNYITYPLLPAVREAMLAMAREEHVLFWDLYAVMGGRNSMPAWVGAEPALAAADHIHFTGRGARRIGSLLGEAFDAEYRLWTTALTAAPLESDSLRSDSLAAP